MRPFGTTNRNPTHNRYSSGYSTCSMCGKQYTHLGIARHWARCRSQGRCYKHDEKLCSCTTECAMQGKRANINGAVL